MEAYEVKATDDAIKCLDEHKLAWAVAVAVDGKEWVCDVEVVFDMVLDAARRADDGHKSED